ncbi:hypothetical protein D0817_25095 [Flavobacterium cupreum]|uniref:Uncharacterized protein n=1 Tax=Flavobacterium cupreum TaxID=2133766 RepID=A0A433ZZY1_9FLAO|nr:hypothetical protein D0817_25095 [Flavobacterium cupreum]
MPERKPPVLDFATSHFLADSIKFPEIHALVGRYFVPSHARPGFLQSGARAPSPGFPESGPATNLLWFLGRFF